MKNFLLLLAGVFVLTACEKEPNMAPKVEDEAEQMTALDRYLQRVAEEGIAMLGDTPTRAGARRMIDPSRTHAFVKATTRSEEDTLFYVVNFIDSTGFALVDANMESPAPLIAVTEQGNYTPGEVTNSGFDLYMDMLSQNSTRGIIPDVEIDSLPHPSIIIGTEIEEGYTDWVSVGPLVAVSWGQGQQTYSHLYPYNWYCRDMEDNICPAGCTAVALAHIFSAHHYPIYCEVTFDDDDNDNHESLMLNWLEINRHHGGYVPNCSLCTDQIHETIQLLFREIGERADIRYMKNRSGTTDLKVRQALSAFGYNNSGLHDYAYSLVKADLDSYCPVYMSGECAGVEYSGHSWVLDGYKSRQYYKYVYERTHFERRLVSATLLNYNYLHINWGYNGNNNGYFASGVFDLVEEYEYDGNYNMKYDYYDSDLKIITGISKKQ